MDTILARIPAIFVFFFSQNCCNPQNSLFCCFLFCFGGENRRGKEKKLWLRNLEKKKKVGKRKRIGSVVMKVGKKELLVVVLVVVVSRFVLLEYQHQGFFWGGEGNGGGRDREMEEQCLGLLKKGEIFRDLAYSKDGWWEDFSASRQAYTKAKHICGALKPTDSDNTRPEELFASVGTKSSLFRENYHRSHLSSVVPLVHWFLGGGFAESDNPSTPFGFSLWFIGEEEGCHTLSTDHSLYRLTPSLTSEDGKCGVIVEGEWPMKVEEVLLGTLGGWEEGGDDEEGEEGGGEGEGCELFLLEDLIDDLPEFLYSVFFPEFLEEGGEGPSIENYRDLGNALGLDQLYIVSVEVQKKFNLVYIADASARSLSMNEEVEELPVVSARSYCQDRSRAVPAGISMTLLAFIMTAYLPPLLQKMGVFSPPSSEADKLQLAVYTLPVSTLVSFVTPWLLRSDMVGLDEISPSPHAHFGRGIGWVFFYCSLLLITPMLLTLIVVVRFKKIVEVLREPWMLQLLSMGSVLGSSLYLFLGSTLYCGFRAFETLPLFPLLLSSAFFLGKFVADFCGGFREIKVYLLSEFCSCILFFALICSVRSSYLMWQALLFVLGFATCVIPIVRHVRLKKKSTTHQERSALFIGGELSGLPSLFGSKKDTLPNALKSHDSLPFHGKSALHASQTLTKTFFSSEPHVAVLLGPRGSGKTRATKEAFNNPSIPFASSSSPASYSVEFPVLSGGKAARPPRFQVHIGSAGHGAHGSEESCPPLQPLMKAFGKLVGYRRFKGAESQFSGVIAADEAIGLSTFLPLNGGEEEEGDGGPDLNVLVDAICRTLKVHCRNLSQEGLRLAIVLEDMEFSDSSTQETIQLLCRRFNQEHDKFGFGITIAICVRDDDLSLNDEGNICLPDWVGACSECLSDSQFSVLRLSSWSLQEIEELLENLGFHSTFIEENAKEFFQKTEGNALWVHNVLKQIWEKDLLQWFSCEFNGDGWIFKDDVLGFKSLPMPTELVRVLQERIAQLSLDDRQLLIAATLIGTEFNAVLLAEAIGRDSLQVLLSLHTLEERTGIISDVRDEEEVYQFSSGGYVDALLGLAELKVTDDAGIPELHRLFHNRLASVLERWIVAREISNISQSIFELARHASFAGARKHRLAFLSNFLAALEVNCSGGGFAELSNYSNVALSCYSSLGKPLISEIFEGTSELEVVCRQHLPSYKAFMASPSHELKIADKIISHLCYLRATSLLKMNPVANKNTALSVFTHYEPKRTPDVLVTLSICYTLKDDFSKAEEMAKLAKGSYSLDPLSEGNVCWALSITRFRQRLLPNFQSKEENSVKRILDLSYEGLTVLSTFLPHLLPLLHALQRGNEQEISQLMNTANKKSQKIPNKEERKKPALRIAAKILCVVGMLYLQENDLIRASFALRIGSKVAQLGKDLFAEVLVGGALARCLCGILTKGEGGEGERKEASGLWKKCWKICSRTDNYPGEVSALVGLGDLAVFKNKIPKATKLYTQALNVAMSRSRKQLEDGAHLKIPPLLSLLHLYFIQPTLPPLSPLLAVKSESDLPESMIVGSESMIEKLSQLLLEDLSLYTTSSLPIDFHLAQHFQKLNKMRGLLERLLSEMDEGDEKRIWAEKLLKKISCVLLMMK